MATFQKQRRTLTTSLWTITLVGFLVFCFFVYAARVLRTSLQANISFLLLFFFKSLLIRHDHRGHDSLLHYPRRQSRAVLHGGPIPGLLRPLCGDPGHG